MKAKKALVLSGGGVKGAYQLGALKALNEAGMLHGLQFIVGSSVGALNAAGLAYAGLRDLELIWLGISKRSDILGTAWWKFWNPKGIYHTRPLRNILNDLIEGPAPKLEAIACTVNIGSGEIRYVSSKDDSQEEFKKGVETSSLIPFFMEPTNGLWFDGGIRENTPLKHAIKKEADEIIVITTNPLGPESAGQYSPKWPKIVSYGMRTVDYPMQAEILKNDLKRCLERNQELQKYRKVDLKIISPERKIDVDTLEFNPQKIREMITMGYEDGEKLAKADKKGIIGS